VPAVPIAVAYTVEVPPARNGQLLVERKALYIKVLVDLKRLQESETVAPATFDAIETFYRHQLDVIREAIHEQQRVETVHQLVVRARRVAHDEAFLKPSSCCSKRPEAITAFIRWIL
jgi:hypothetical protein